MMEAGFSQTEFQGPGWAPLTVIRPHVGSVKNATAEISSPLVGKRLALSRQAVLSTLASIYGQTSEKGHGIVEFLKNHDLFGRVELDSATSKAIGHWEQRGWSQALPYYLSSRKTEFYDEGCDYRVKQEEALSKYIAETEEVPRPRAVGPDAVPLSEPCELPDQQLGAVMFRRASTNTFRSRTLPQTQLSAVLVHGLRPIQGNRRPDISDIRRFLRSSGCALDVFLAVYDVEGIQPGVYFYDIDTNQIELLRKGLLREEVQHCLIGQDSPLTGSCTFFLSADFQRYQWRYRHERALRNLYMDMAWIAQRLILVATSFHWRTSMTPACRDTETCELLGINSSEQQVLYTLTFG